MEQIRAGLAGCIDQGGIATFELPKAATRASAGLLLVSPARNPSAFEAWGEHFQRQFPGQQAQILLEPASDWRPADAGPLVARLRQCFSDITIALNADAGSFVEELEMAHPSLHNRPRGQSSDLLACLDQLLTGDLGADLVCVCPANAAGFLSALRHLETKGLRRRSSGGLASVRHCR